MFWHTLAAAELASKTAVPIEIKCISDVSKTWKRVLGLGLLLLLWPLIKKEKPNRQRSVDRPCIYNFCKKEP